MGEIGHDGLAFPGQVILAHEPSFTLGVLSVHPATRQVASHSRSETLEPRVMQVLVALYRADGIVTRDELTERCWDGRIVSEDAINRVLSRIRHVAGGIGAESFKVETITKVGYRLIGGGVRWRPPSLAASSLTPLTINRRRLIGGAAAAGSIVAVGAIVAWRRTARQDGPSPEAKLLYERALAVLQADYGPVNNRQAMAFLREALRISPDYGEAWGVLALTYRSALLNESPDRVAGLEERFQEAVRQAERFDPGNADAAAAMLPREPAFGRWIERERLYQAFLQRHADHVAGYNALGTMLMDVGRWTDAVASLRVAKVRNPFDPILRYKLSVSLWGAGRISEAEDEIDKAMLRWPQHGAIWQTKIKLLALTGRPKAALDLVNDATGRPLDEPESYVQERLLYLTALATRTPDDVDKAVEAMTRRARDIPRDRITMAIQCAMLGRQQLALAMLEGAYLSVGDWALAPADSPFVLTHPLFQPHARLLWSEPRFDRILAAIGLEQYWRFTKTRPEYRRA